MRSRTLVSRITVLIVAILLPLTALAGDEVGKMKGNSSMIEWELTRSGHASIVLTVQTPSGKIFQKEFHGMQNPTWRASDMKGAVEDGVYTWEMRVTPAISGAVKAALAAARASGDDARVSEILKANGLENPVVQSGAFGALNGAFLDNTAKEPGATAGYGAESSRGSVSSSATGSTGVHRPGEVTAEDQVIPDDLIVQSSTCTGFDCVDGESFGFDTLRLKENNLRIHFDDTSTSAGYPANDWRIVANDSASGGANKFVIEDSTVARNPMTIEAAAPANALYVDSTGNIGLQQSAPGLDLHLTMSDTPAIRLEQTNAGGFTAQTWDVAGNEANFFVRDLTGGSKLPFRIRPGATTSSIDIAASGNVGINNSGAGAYNLDVIQASTNNGALRVYTSTTNNKPGIEFMTSTTTDNRILSFDRQANTWKTLFLEHGTGIVGTYFHSNGFVGVNTATPLSRLHVTGDVRVTSGSFIDDGTTLNVPDYVFEDSYKLMPMEELASFIKANKHLPNVPSAKDIAAKGVNMSKFQMNLLEKVEELTLYTVSQHEQITALKAQNTELMERLAALEKAIGNK